MKKIISFIVLFCVFSSQVFADCDYSKITNNSDGTYVYSKELHICVGQMKKDLEVANKQVDMLNKAIELKDLAMSKSNERLALWMDTTYKLEDRINKIDELQSKNNWLYFGLGVAATTLAVYSASKIIQR